MILIELFLVVIVVLVDLENLVVLIDNFLVNLLLLRILMFDFLVCMILVFLRIIGVILVLFLKIFNWLRFIRVYFFVLMFENLCFGIWWNNGVCLFLKLRCILLLLCVFCFFWLCLEVLLLFEDVLWFIWLWILCDFFVGFNLWSFIIFFFYL